MKIRQLCFIVTMAVLSACQSRQTSESADTTGSSTVDTTGAVTAGPKLIVRLSASDNSASKDSIVLKFTVVNNADSVQHFVKWDTPFEPLLGKYLSVTDEHNKEAQYIGPMAKRMMPPPADSYIAVNPHDSVSRSFDLLKGYSAAPGRYTVKYTASGISGLSPENEIKINVPAK